MADQKEKQLDAELQYGGTAFVEDEADEGCPAFVPDEDEDNAVPAFEDDDGQEQEAEPAAPPPVSDPAPSDGQAQAETQPTANDAAKTAVDEDDKRKAHEEAEAKRKAEWEARQAKKEAEEQKKLGALATMSDDEVLAASLKRMSADTEKLTRRNMMECVMENIQTLCLSDPAFARKVMHPRKNMIRCYQYINRKAWEYVQDEMKARGITPGRDNPSYASAIPEGICYQWAVDYFNDPDAKEDQETGEKFVPQPYRGTSTASTKKSAAKGKAKNGNSKKDAPKPAPKTENEGQISLLGVA